MVKEVAVADQVARMAGLRQMARAVLGGMGLLKASRLLRVFLRHGARGVSRYRLVEQRPQRMAAFVRRYAETFESARTELQSDARKVLVIGSIALQQG